MQNTYSMKTPKGIFAGKTRSEVIANVKRYNKRHPKEQYDLRSVTKYEYFTGGFAKLKKQQK